MAVVEGMPSRDWKMVWMAYSKGVIEAMSFDNAGSCDAERE